MSRTLRGPIDNVSLVHDVIAGAVRAIKQRARKDIWLFGGGKLFRTMLDARLVDRIEVSIVPILLGAGVKLVSDGVRHRLRFVSSRAFQSGIQQLIYDVVQ